MNAFVVECSAGNIYIVRECDDPGLSHCYIGSPAKKSAGGYVLKANARERLIRRVGTRVILNIA